MELQVIEQRIEDFLTKVAKDEAPVLTAAGGKADRSAPLNISSLTLVDLMIEIEENLDLDLSDYQVTQEMSVSEIASIVKQAMEG